MLLSLCYLTPVHFHHLEPAHRLRLLFDVFPQQTQLAVPRRRMFWFGIASRNSWRARHISVYIQTRSDRWRVVIRLAARRSSCSNLSTAVVRLVVDTQAFGHGAGRGEGAPWSLQPLPQGRAQFGVTLRTRGRKLLYNVRLISTRQSHQNVS